jgi:hypothetical protein
MKAREFDKRFDEGKDISNTLMCRKHEDEDKNKKE